MGRRGRDVITSRYAVDTMVDAILAVYREAWAGTARGRRDALEAAPLR